jgi:hypothetical protein
VAHNLGLGLAPPPDEARLREALARVELDALGEGRGLATEVRLVAVGAVYGVAALLFGAVPPEIGHALTLRRDE